MNIQVLSSATYSRPEHYMVISQPSGEILAPFHYASEKSPSTNHTESSEDMTDVLNMVENIETLNRQTADSLLLTQIMYSHSLRLPKYRPMVKCCLLPNQPEVKMPDKVRKETVIIQSSCLDTNLLVI